MSGPLPVDRRPVPRIDPRIRARRIAIRRTEGRRRLHWLGGVGVLAGVAGVAVGVALSPLLDVDRIQVDGAARAGRDAVLVASGIDRGDPLVILDLASAAEGVRSLPWVEDVTVRRSWPGTVEVSVAERIPAAGLAQGDGRVALVDEGAHVLDVVAGDESGVVRVEGLPAGLVPGDEVGGMARPAIAVAAAIPAHLRPRVPRIVVTPEDHLLLELVVEDGEPPGVVRLGDASQLAEKVRALVTMVASADLTDLAVLDLEVPAAPALTRR